MSEEPFRRLQIARKEAGFPSARKAAEHFGWSYSTYAAHENGQNNIKPAAAQRYARAFKRNFMWLLTGEEGKTLATVAGVPLVGEVAAGLWLELDDALQIDDIAIPAVPDHRFPIEYQVALRVRGPSMNRVMQDGTYAIGVLYDHAYRKVRDGDLVVVRRFRNGLVETTLKRYRETLDGAELHPESDDARFQTALELGPDNDDTTLEIYALVIGSYRPFV